MPHTLWVLPAELHVCLGPEVLRTSAPGQVCHVREEGPSSISESDLCTTLTVVAQSVMLATDMPRLCWACLVYFFHEKPLHPQ